MNHMMFMAEPLDGSAAVSSTAEAVVPAPSQNINLTVQLSSAPRTAARSHLPDLSLSLSLASSPLPHLPVWRSGGLEILFGRVKQHSLRLSPAAHGDDGALTLRALIRYMKDQLIKERPDLFAQDDTVSAHTLLSLTSALVHLCQLSDRPLCAVTAGAPVSWC